MKNLIIYYFTILIPLPILVWLAFSNKTNSFVILLLFYALVYRPIIDGYRLIEKGVISKKGFWELFIPFWSIKWFKELYFLKAHNSV